MNERTKSIKEALRLTLTGAGQRGARRERRPGREYSMKALGTERFEQQSIRCQMLPLSDRCPFRSVKP